MQSKNFIFFSFLYLTILSKFAQANEEAILEIFENNFEEIFGPIEEPPVINQRNALQSETYRWPDKTLYYYINSDYNASESDNVRQAVNELSDKTCLRFIEINAENPKPSKVKRYLFYKKNKDMCGTKAGYRAYSLQEGAAHNIEMNDYCASKKGIIQHETLHAVGLHHEQSRQDRDKYVKVMYDNIDPIYRSQFDKKAYTTTFDVEYNYESIMHYSPFAFAKDRSKPSMKAIVDGKLVDRPMGQIREPAESDYEKVKKMYKC